MKILFHSRFCVSPHPSPFGHQAALFAAPDQSPLAARDRFENWRANGPFDLRGREGVLEEILAGGPAWPIARGQLQCGNAVERVQSGQAAGRVCGPNARATSPRPHRNGIPRAAPLGSCLGSRGPNSLDIFPSATARPSTSVARCSYLDAVRRGPPNWELLGRPTDASPPPSATLSSEACRTRPESPSPPSEGACALRGSMLP